jgi:hypothetical protein
MSAAFSADAVASPQASTRATRRPTPRRYARASVGWETWADIQDTVVFALTPEAPGDKLEQFNRERLEQFLPVEKAAVEEYLRYFLARTRPDAAGAQMRKAYEGTRDRLGTFWSID